MESVLNRILTLNLVATTVVFYVAARIYLLPHLSQWRPRAVLIPILLLHSLRHLGLMFLTRGATYPAEDAEDVAWLKKMRKKPLRYRPLEEYLAQRKARV
jgi:hypothetical protein